MPYIQKPIDRYQVSMDTLDGMVACDSMARVIDAFVDRLDLVSMGFAKSKAKNEGRPCYDPHSLLKLYFYGYRNGIFSSRKLARACETNIEVMWMLGGLRPDFRTISDFRKDNASNLKSVFREFVRRVTVDVDTGFVSVDGSKFRAVNAKDKNFTITKIDDRIKWLDDHAQEYLRLMDEADREENAEGTLTREMLEAKLKETRERLERYRGYRDIMESENLTQLSLTDADARLMKNRNGMDVSYNVQTAVSSETHLIMDYQMTNQVTDHGMLAPTTERIRNDSDGSVVEVVADKGYDKAEDMIKCLENGVIPHVILPDGKDDYELEVPYEEAEELHPESTESSELRKCIRAGVVPEAYQDFLEDMEVVEVNRMIRSETTANAEQPYGSEEELKARAAEGFFVRDPERDLVYCPAGNTLRKKCIKSNGATRYANKHVCTNCPFRDRCVRNKGITKWKEIDFGKDRLEIKAKWCQEDQTNQEEKESTGRQKAKRQFEKVKLVRFRLRPNRQKMNQRMCLSEHPFGTLKRAMGATYFLLKGMLKTDGEFALLSMGYNLTRAENLWGFDGLMMKVTG
ncbi:MAG: transposase [Lachnospiraceae bacterium]|nr:transposase [Lachnospiraceae bacterium]